MTRQEFVEAWRHELGGMILDAATAQLKGADLSLFMRQILRKVDATLGKQFDALSDPKPQANGHTNGAAARPARN